MVVWPAMRGELVRGVMGLTPRQAAQTLPDYAASRCSVCGAMGVETHAIVDGTQICSLCDSPVEAL